MRTPEFTFDSDMNGYISESFTVEEHAVVHIELASRAPVVILKMEGDGGYANYGQTPKNAEGYEINITTKRKEVIMIASPVEVTKCYILN